MEYYMIENEGEVDVNGFKLIGATTKDETQIGYFGSGIKYALATAMRQAIGIKAFTGEREIGITTKPVTMRDQTFDVIYIDGEATSITTGMGRDWETWFIVREFYCNAIDEGSSEIIPVDTPVGIAGKTRIFIEMTTEIKKIVMNLDKYFSVNREASFEAPNFKVYNRADHENGIIYRRGVRVFSKTRNLYDYDLPEVEINESREASIFDITWKLAYHWKTQATPEMIVALYSDRASMEFNMDWDYGGGGLNDAWWLALTDRTIVPVEQAGYFADELSEFCIFLPHKLCKLLHKAFGAKLKIKGMLDSGALIVESEFDKREHELLDRAMTFLKSSKYFSEIPEGNIKLAILDKNVLGTVDGTMIYLSPEVFHMGLRQVVSTIIEEWLHIKSHASDRTRLFQDTLISIVVDTIEEQSGVYL